jgi:pectate lyase
VKAVLLGVAALSLAACGDQRLTTLRGPDGAAPTGDCPRGLVGYATVGQGTAGGQGGKTVRARSLVDLQVATAKADPLVIEIEGMLTLTGQIKVAPQKTIVGVGSQSGLDGGGLDLTDGSDIILRNLVIRKAIGTDAVTIYNAHHVWVDHCDLSSDLDHDSEYYDGLVDIVHGSHDVTVSWRRFHDHAHVSLIGHSDQPAPGDTEQTATFHHNLFDTTSTYNPTIRFGMLHAFNNAYRDVSSQGISARMGARVLAEANHFDTVPRPLTTHDASPTDGFINDVANVMLDSGPSTITQPSTWTPDGAYPYAPDPADTVPALVDRCAGTKL